MWENKRVSHVKARGSARKKKAHGIHKKARKCFSRLIRVEQAWNTRENTKIERKAWKCYLSLKHRRVWHTLTRVDQREKKEGLNKRLRRRLTLFKSRTDCVERKIPITFSSKNDSHLFWDRAQLNERYKTSIPFWHSLVTLLEAILDEKGQLFFSRYILKRKNIEQSLALIFKGASWFKIWSQPFFC